MSNALNVIEEEIKSFDEMLKSHSYHLYALRQLRKKLIAKEAEFIEPPKPLVVETLVETNNHLHPNRVSQKRVNQVARMVAEMIRDKTFNTKTKALDALLRNGVISSQERTRTELKMVPCHMGTSMYNRIFKGTKYVK